jgi:hypothetical protein
LASSKLTAAAILLVFVWWFAYDLDIANLGPQVPSPQVPNSVNFESNSPAVLTQLLPQMPGWNLSFAFRDTAYQGALQGAAALVFTYQRNSSTGQEQSVYAEVWIGPYYHTPLALLDLCLNSSCSSSPSPLLYQTTSNSTSSGPQFFFVYQKANDTDCPSRQTAVTVGGAIFTASKLVCPPTLYALGGPDRVTEAVLWRTSLSTLPVNGTQQKDWVLISFYQTIPALFNAGLISNS